jgi:uncharacterized protein (DUF1778 family)
MWEVPMERKKMGRPTIEAEDRRTYRITVALKEDEAEMIKWAAVRVGSNVSQFVRNAARTETKRVMDEFYLSKTEQGA